MLEVSRVMFAQVSNPAGPELSIIVPTFNESANVAEVVRRLDAALAASSVLTWRK
jgi:cellulose synthase/poly-beta-1,6-N-acetylglucosamine synthase-like glycosyltransferase